MRDWRRAIVPDDSQAKRAKKAPKSTEKTDGASADDATVDEDAGDDAEDAQGDAVGDGEMEDGEDLDHRRRDDDASIEAQRDADRTRMSELLKTFTPSQMERYECFRRSNLSKTTLRRLFKAASGVTLNANGLIILAGVSKMFVGEMVETAREIMKSRGMNEYEEIRPEHLREAAAVIDAKDGLLRRKRQKSLFARRYA
jgi:transcription initiation factor TFIID subunit 11